MGDVTNGYHKIANAQNKVTRAITKFTKDYFAFVILIINIVVMICSRLFTTWLENPFTPDFFASLGMNLLTTMLCYSCFVKYAERNEKEFNESYAHNVEIWGRMSGEVRQHYNKEFTEYCKKQVELEREEKRHLWIINKTMISVSQYDEVYRNLSRKEVMNLVKEGKITKEEAKYIKKANNTHKVKPINPMLIICGVEETNENNAGRKVMQVSPIALKPLSTLILTVCITMLKGRFVGINDASAIFDMMWTIISIVIASFSGYTAGTQTVIRELNTIKSRIFFLEKFLDNIHKAA